MKAFIHIPKTGGTAVIKYSGLDLIVVDHATYASKHYDLTDYRIDYPKQEAFAIIRNPIERFISAYSYLRNGGTTIRDQNDRDIFLKPYSSISDFIHRGIERAMSRQIHFVSQHYWIDKETTLVPYDYVNEYINKLRILEGKKEQELPTINRTFNKVKLTQKERQDIADIYQEDFKLYKKALKQWH